MFDAKTLVLSHLALELKLSVYLHLHKRKHNVFKKIFYKNFVKSVFQDEINQACSIFFEKKLLLFNRN